MKKVIICTAAICLMTACASTRPSTTRYIWREAQFAMAEHERYEHDVMAENFPEYTEEIDMRRKWDDLVRDLDNAMFSHLRRNRPDGINVDGGIGPFLLVGTSDDMLVLAASDPEFAVLMAERDSLKLMIRRSGRRMRELSVLTMPESEQARVSESLTDMTARLESLAAQLSSVNR